MGNRPSNHRILQISDSYSTDDDTGVTFIGNMSVKCISNWNKLKSVSYFIGKYESNKLSNSETSTVCDQVPSRNQEMSIVLPATAKQTASVIFLHGLGDTG